MCCAVAAAVTSRHGSPHHGKSDREVGASSHAGVAALVRSWFAALASGLLGRRRVLAAHAASAALPIRGRFLPPLC